MAGDRSHGGEDDDGLQQEECQGGQGQEVEQEQSQVTSGLVNRKNIFHKIISLQTIFTLIVREECQERSNLTTQQTHLKHQLSKVVFVKQPETNNIIQ